MFFYDGWQVCEEQSAAGITLATYVYSPVYIDEPVQMVRGGQEYYLHQNARADVVAITDASGAVRERRFYDDFGRAYDSGKLPILASAVGNPYGFQGRRLDAETGLYYFRNRYYDTETGRFLQRDPVWDAENFGGQYSFGWSGPASARDPLGTQETQAAETGFKALRTAAREYLRREGKKRLVQTLLTAQAAGRAGAQTGRGSGPQGAVAAAGWTTGETVAKLIHRTYRLDQAVRRLRTQNKQRKADQTRQVLDEIDPTRVTTRETTAFVMRYRMMRGEDPSPTEIHDFWNSQGTGKTSDYTSTGSSASDTRTDEEFIQDIANKAESWGRGKSDIGPAGGGSSQGTKKHKHAQDLILEYQRRTGKRKHLQVEQSYLQGEPVPYGTKGSSRPDVYDPQTGKIYDFKFVKNPGRGIPKSQRDRNLRNVPYVTSQTEINPR